MDGLIVTISVDPNEVLQFAASHLGLQALQNSFNELALDFGTYTISLGWNT